MSDPRFLTDTFAVSPQIGPEELEGLKAQGFRTIVCNRPDGEIPPEIQADAVARECERLGLAFVLNPLSHGSLTLDHVDRQREAAQSDGMVFAYCTSGNRSSILWALAIAGEMSTDDIIERTMRAGYNLSGLIPQLQALEAQSKS